MDALTILLNNPLVQIVLVMFVIRIVASRFS